MQTPDPKAYCFEGYTLDLRRGCLRSADREIDLRPKSFGVLRHLVENAGRLVSKDELIKTVWPDVIVTDESLARCVSEVRLALGDSDQCVIKTVARRGYLFAASISPHPVGAKGVISNFFADSSRSPPPRLSVVVLPFVNLSDEKAQDYFVDGITESLTTDLSRIHGAFVIARNSAFTYKGEAVDARQIGRDLGVRYLMEGSVQTSQDRIRVSAQLIDTENGAHLWAERFDKARADLFEMQDEITARLARAIGVELVASESRTAERERPNNMDAVDLAMRGWTIANRPYSLTSARQARTLFERSLRLDGQNIDALIGLADTHLYEVSRCTSDSPAEQIRIAEGAISEALRLAPGSARAHYLQAIVLFLSGAPERALRQCELVISLDRNHAWSHAVTGWVKIWLGRAQETEAHVVEAFRLSPREPLACYWHLFLGCADLYLGWFDRAVDRLRKSVEILPEFETAPYFLAAALALAGRKTEAAGAAAEGRRLVPNFTIAKFRSAAKGGAPAFIAQRERIIDALRGIGVPE